MIKETFSGWIRLALALPLRGRSGFAHRDMEETLILKLRHYRLLSLTCVDGTLVLDTKHAELDARAHEAP